MTDTTTGRRGYRVSDAHAATIARLHADATAAGFRPRITYTPDAAADVDAVTVHVATPYDNGPHTDHAVIAWYSWTDRLSVRPGPSITLDQVGPYLAAYRERMRIDRYGIGGDGLDAVYRAVTGRSAYGRQPNLGPASAAPYVSAWAGELGGAR